MGEVELDRPAATRLEIDEERPFAGPQDVALVRLAVQQLLAGALCADGRAEGVQPGAERRTVGRSQLGAARRALEDPSRISHSIGEVRCADVDLAQPGMEPGEG